MAIVCLEQARLFNRPGTNDAPCTLLERCFADWHESSKVSTKKTTDEEWKFPLSRAEVKKKKKEWDKRSARRVGFFLSPLCTPTTPLHVDIM